MLRLETSEALQATVREWRRQPLRIGFVPTMGALHRGHLRLAEAAVERCDLTVASIFVNPTQFGPDEDLGAYPRDIDGDAAKLEAAGVSAVFFPSAETMYPNGFQTWVTSGPLAGPLCGRSRPDHFRGVTTVLTKLFHQVSPDLAFFGQKDFQQVRVVEQMVSDLDFELEVKMVATVREADGLALSSRNQYLTTEERAVAPTLNRALRAVVAAFEAGERDPVALLRSGREVLESQPLLREDYFEVRNDTTLEVPTRITDGAVVAAAVHVGETRLIDNELLGTARQRIR